MILTKQKRLEILIGARLLRLAVRTETGPNAKLDGELARLDALITQAKAAPEDGSR